MGSDPVPSPMGPSAPHLHEGASTSGIMFRVVLCLLPTALWGVLLFGLRALFVLLVSTAAGLLAELAVAGLFFRRFTLADGSALLTGLLLGLSMPPSVPLFVPAAASLFAIAVIKMSFGGLGRNWMNPALGGWVFALFSWEGLMSRWGLPPAVPLDGSSGATPLGLARAALASQAPGLRGPIDALWGRLQPKDFLQPLLRLLPPNYGELLLGGACGCIGEGSAILLFLGSAYLLIEKIIAWEIPASYLGSFLLLSWVFGGLPYRVGLFRGDAVFHLLTGGLALGALFMATDPVTSPVRRPGRVLFGLGCGVLTFLLRTYGGRPEGVALAIVLMNMFTPLLDRIGRRVRARGAVK